MSGIDIARLEIAEHFICGICAQIMKQHIRDYHKVAKE